MAGLLITLNHCRNTCLQLSNEVVKHKADFGIAVDPDVDRFVLFVKMEVCLGKNIRWWQLLIMY